MSIKNKLNRMKKHIKKEDNTSNLSITHPKTDIPYISTWQNENVKPYWFDNDYCLIREVKYSLDHQHGKYPFKKVIEAVEQWNKSSLEHPLSAKGHIPQDLFFFDTETTGLGGGTGNTIFILGYARVIDNNIVLKQHILPHPGAEVPFYQSFLENVDYTTLVTYNGKAFDWPQVRTRHMFVKEHVPMLPEFGHFDLYHAARRLWKHRLERTKLSIVEEEVLEVKRKDDVPGFLAPMIYFDFVERKDPEGMLAILKHNEIDILSLITLYTHLSFQLLAKDKKMSARETLEVGRWFSTLGEYQAAKDTLNILTEEAKEESLMANFILACQYKKKKEINKAIILWESIIETYTPQTEKNILFDSYIELAKIKEHKEKNLQQALRLTIQAKHLLENMVLKESRKNKKHFELQKRQKRLEEKILKKN